MAKTHSEDFSSRALAKNVVFSVVTFALNFFISFYITPRITKNFGSETYGYLKLANDFASYAALFSIALNSMASRFIMLERSRGNQREAQRYFSSVGVANTILAAVFILPAALCVRYLDSLFVISPALVAEVKLTYALTFTNFILQLFFSIYSNCYYITNTLYLSSLRTAQAGILNAVTVLSLFFFFRPRLSYVVCGTLAATVFTVSANSYNTRRLTPDLRFRFSDFSPSRIWTILSSGVWNSITQLSNLLTNQLDLLITNLFIGAETMGFLSVAKTAPNVIISFNATVANVFSPNLMRLYAQDDREGMKKAAKTAMRFMCLFVSIPNAILLTMGTQFYSLWVPEQPAALINTFTVLTILNSCVTGPLQPLYQIFTITNKVRENALVMIAYGFAYLGVVYALLRLTDWGVYAILGTNLVGSLLVASFYHLPYAAKHIGLSRWAFFPEIGKSILSFVIVSAIGFCLSRAVALDSWLRWFAAAACTGLLGFGCNLFVVLDAEERRFLWDKVSGKLRGLLGKG